MSRNILAEMLSTIFSVFKSKRVTKADCQVYFEKIATVPCVTNECKTTY